MLTVTELARSCGLSRTTLLYYESIGLLRRPARSAGNYRLYGQRDVDRLRQVCVYRNAGVALADIRTILDRPDGDAATVLKRRLAELDAEVGRLRAHQREILMLLRSKARFTRKEMATKEKWVEVMKRAGFSEADMERWHSEFEKSAPEDHQEFLEFLHIPADEIRRIREWSRTGKPPA